MQPTGKQFKAARLSAGLTQPQAAALIHSKHRTLQDWEADKATVHAGLWELFLIKTNQLHLLA